MRGGLVKYSFPKCSVHNLTTFYTQCTSVAGPNVQCPVKIVNLHVTTFGQRVILRLKSKEFGKFGKIQWLLISKLLWVSEFSRVGSRGGTMHRGTPISVPKDWRRQLSEISENISNEFNDLYEKIGGEQAGAQMEMEPTTFYKGDVFSYFETVIATPEIASAVKNQAQYYYQDDPAPNPEWGRTWAWFSDWWICTRFKVNRVTLQRYQMKYTIVTNRALAEYFLTEDVKKSYRIMTKEMRGMGFIEGNVN